MRHAANIFRPSELSTNLRNQRTGSAGSACNLSKLFAVQKKAIHTLFHIRRLSRYIPNHTKTVLSINEVLTIYNRYFYQR